MGACKIQVRHGEASRGDHSVLMPNHPCFVNTLALTVGNRTCLSNVLQRLCTKLLAHCTVSAQLFAAMAKLESLTVLPKAVQNVADYTEPRRRGIVWAW